MINIFNTFKKIKSKRLDGITVKKARKLHRKGRDTITGNGRVYGFFLPEDTEQAERIRNLYDAMEG